MFGPDTELLSGRHVIFIDLGDPAALAEARGKVPGLRTVMWGDGEPCPPAVATADLRIVA